MNKKVIYSLVTVSGLALMLTACGGNGQKQSGGNTDTAEKNFVIETSNKEKAIDGGTLKIANVSNADFTGVFSPAFSTNTTDSQFQEPAFESLFNYDEDLRYIDGGAAKFKFDEATKTVTITINDGVKWNDGHDLTADDLIFTYEIIGNKEYTGVRYDDKKRNIVGMEDYHAGKAETISGIKKVNDKEITIEFIELAPTIVQGGGAIVSYAVPKHAMEGIAIKDMEGSAPIRKQPITFGPYQISKIQPGESVEYTRNEYYYGEKPKLDKIVMKKVPVASAAESMKQHEYDMYWNMPADQYGVWKDLDGYELVGQKDLQYNYIGFRTGEWDAKQGKNVMDPNAKMSDKALRQAMSYAIDNQAIADQLYHGLQESANSLITPAFKNFHDADLKGYTQDLEKANKLLEDAGYKDVNGDGIREDKEGKPMKLSFAFRDQGDIGQSLSAYYIQSWKDVGLDVELNTGRLIEVNNFYDKLKSSDTSIDLYQAGWSTGYDPNQQGTYGETAQFNYSRFVSEKNNELLSRMGSADALDPAKAAEIYKEWQEYAFEEAFTIPTTYSYRVVPVSKRVTGYSVKRDNVGNTYATLGVTE